MTQRNEDGEYEYEKSRLNTQYMTAKSFNLESSIEKLGNLSA